MLPVAARFDHAVICAHDDLDAVAVRYRRLGFTVTPAATTRSARSTTCWCWGARTSNCSATPRAWPGEPELASAARGLDALVFGSDDADAHAARRWRAVRRCSRCSRSAGRCSSKTASSRRGSARCGSFPGPRRLGGCTSASTRRRSWCGARPGSTTPTMPAKLVGVAVEVPDLARELAAYRAALGPPAIAAADDAHFVVDAAPVRIDVRRSNRAAMTTLTLRVTDLARTRAALQRGAVPFADHGDAIAVRPEDAAGVWLRFAQAAG